MGSVPSPYSLSEGFSLDLSPTTNPSNILIEKKWELLGLSGPSIAHGEKGREFQIKFFLNRRGRRRGGRWRGA